MSSAHSGSIFSQHEEVSEENRLYVFQTLEGFLEEMEQSVLREISDKAPESPSRKGQRQSLQQLSARTDKDERRQANLWKVV